MATTTDPLASLDDLEARLEFEILDDERLTKLAKSALTDASTLVREYGLRSWTEETAPPIAVMLTLKAAARFVNNPMSLETARGADETNMWGSANANGVYLQDDEIELLREHRKTDKGFQAPRTYAYSAAPARPLPPGGHYWPVADYGLGGAKWFPDYHRGDTYFPIYPTEWR